MDSAVPVKFCPGKSGWSMTVRSTTGRSSTSVERRRYHPDSGSATTYVLISMLKFNFVCLCRRSWTGYLELTAVARKAIVGRMNFIWAVIKGWTRILGNIWVIKRADCLEERSEWMMADDECGEEIDFEQKTSSFYIPHQQLISKSLLLQSSGRNSWKVIIETCTTVEHLVDTW